MPWVACSKQHGHQAWLTATTCRRHRSTEGARKKPPIYKVMLHNDNYNRREYVVKVLLKVVEGMTVDDAVVVMQVRYALGTWRGGVGRFRATYTLNPN